MEPELISETVKIFSPQLFSGRKGDYHKNINSENFTSWLKNSLLPSLKEPSMIKMDNAALHKGRSTWAPIPNKMKKSDILSYLTEKGIICTDNTTVIESRIMLHDYVSLNISLDVMQAAKSCGRQVIFTRLHYPDLQATELLWAQIKGSIAQKNCNGTNLTTVKARFDKELDLLNTVQANLLIEKNISHIDKRITELK